VRSGWISSLGGFIPEFEREFAEFCGGRFGIAVCNGTAAVHLALVACGVGQGDEVLVPSLTYVVTANAVRYCGATPVFVDADPDIWCMQTAGLDAMVTPRLPSGLNLERSQVARVVRALGEALDA